MRGTVGSQNDNTQNHDDRLSAVVWISINFMISNLPSGRNPTLQELQPQEEPLLQVPEQQFEQELG